jgi:hypothetical protein
VKILIYLFAGFLSLICSANDEHSNHITENGRMGLHGMVIYGSQGQYFLDHIPMNHSPHDFQVVAQVTLKTFNGKDVLVDLSQSGFINGALTEFRAEVYSGSFEKEGQPVKGLEKIFVSVKNIEYARKIPSKSIGKAIQFKTSKNTFEVNVITPLRNYQSVKNILTGKILWCVKGPDFFDPC